MNVGVNKNNNALILGKTERKLQKTIMLQFQMKVEVKKNASI